MNWELITQGLELSVMGIITTFMALGLFIGTILLLRYLFPAEPRVKKVADLPQAVEEPAAVAASEDDSDAVAAAISAAIYVKNMLASSSDSSSYVPRRTGLGARLEQPRGRWWQAMEYEKDWGQGD